MQKITFPGSPKRSSSVILVLLSKIRAIQPPLVELVLLHPLRPGGWGVILIHPQGYAAIPGALIRVLLYVQ